METTQRSGGRYTLDCRDYPGSKCSLAISGSKDEVLKEGVRHAVSDHGEKDEPGLRDKLSQSLKEEKTYRA